MAVLALCGGTLASVGSSGAQAPGLSGGAYGYYANVGLFGGRWPPKVAMAPPSGPLTVTTTGKTGPGGFVTSTAEIGRNPKPVPVQCEGEPMGSTNCTAPGGFGPSPPTEGDELRSTCTANAKGVTGSTRLVNAVLALATDRDGAPINEQPVPENPPPNYTRDGELTNVGDKFRIVFNEQITGPDGSLTVNAVHLYLLGPVAKGESILGQVRCATGGAVSEGPAPPTSSRGPATSVPVPADDEGSGSSALPVALAGGGALLAGGAGLAFWTRSRRRRTTDDEWLNDGR